MKGLTTSFDFKRLSGIMIMFYHFSRASVKSCYLRFYCSFISRNFFVGWSKLRILFFFVLLFFSTKVTLFALVILL